MKKKVICLVVSVGLMLCAFLQISHAEQSRYEWLYSSRFGAGSRVNYEYADDMGMVWMRMPFDVNIDNYNHITLLDNMVKKGQEQDLMMLGIINPRSDQSGNWLSPEQFAETVSLIVKRYNGDGEDDMPGLKYPIKIWEFFNEYSSNPHNVQYKGLSQDDFVEMMEAAFTAARNVCPDIVILYNPFDERDASALLEKISPDEIDIISYHTYSPLDVPHNPDGFGYIPVYFNMLERLGLKHKPVWVTEYSFEDHEGAVMNPYEPMGSLEDNARWFVQTTAWGFGSGSFDKIIYSEAVATPGNTKLEWSAMVDSDQPGANKRQIYYAFKKMAELIDRFSSVRELSLPDDVYGYEFTVGGEKISVLWSKEGTGLKNDVTLSGLTGGSQAELITAVPDQSGHFASELKTVNDGKLTLDTLTETPLYLRMIAEPEPEPEPGDPEEHNWYVWPSQETSDTFKKWTVRFSKTPAQSFVDSDTLYIEDERGEKITVDYCFGGNEIIVEPKTNYIQGKTYTLFIKNLKAEDNTPLKQNLKMGFTITGTELPEFTWTTEPGIRLEGGSVPFVLGLEEGCRMYYGGHGGILSAFSADGLTFTKDEGVRIMGSPGSIVSDPTVVMLPDGGMRMYYKWASGPGGPGNSVHKIYSSYSSDGVIFTVDAGVRIDSEETEDKGWASVPEAIVLSDGSIRIYYVSDGDDVRHGIVSAISEDGLIFTREGPVLTGFVDPAVVRLSGGQYLMLAVAFPDAAGRKEAGTELGIYSFLSDNGTDFEKQSLVLPGEGNIDPAIVALQDVSGFRVYYWNLSDDPPVIMSIQGVPVLE